MTGNTNNGYVVVHYRLDHTPKYSFYHTHENAKNEVSRIMKMGDPDITVFMRPCIAKDRPARPYYVTKTWENFPEGGSCGEIVWACSYQTAEEVMIEIMIDNRSSEWFEEGMSPEEEKASREAYKEANASDWHTIDCTPVREMVQQFAIQGLLL